MIRIGFDVGGTTAKVSVIRGGAPAVVRVFHADRFVDGRDVGGYPIASPAIDLIEKLNQRLGYAQPEPSKDKP